MSNRRDFLKKGALLSLSGLATGLIGKDKINNLESATGFLSDEGKSFTLPPLPYAYDALEPFIDKQTMEIHHTKHHQAYVDKLNAAANASNIDYKVDDAGKCRNVGTNTVPAIRNNLGGHYNHSMFWQMLKPNPEGKANLPSGKLADAINKDFKSFDDFKKEFSDKASKIFGSGWCWLVVDASNKLKVTTTPNQDNPLMKVASENGTPVIGLDVWEHAYYLKYQNKRADYINNWWNVANWQKAEELFTQK
jgi:Fe-Mn family superoxide dismutase